jgi:hypothetical protein
VGNFRHPIIPLSFLTFIVLHLCVTPTLPAQAAEETPQFNPPWSQTKERIPQEVKDKEKEAPLAWCENKEKKEFEVTYRDPNTGTQVRIKRREDWSEPRPIQEGRFEIVSGIRFPKSVWEITIDEPGKPRRKITYDLDFYRGDTRTEQVDREPPTTRPVRESDLFDPQKVKKGALLRDLSPNQMARVTFRTSDPDSPWRREIVSGYHLPTLLAATLERAETQTPQTQERPPLNVKLVHYGKPTETPTFHLDPDPKITPEEFVQKSPPTTWLPEDRDGPTAVAPGPTKTPITLLPGGGINIGSGWASARIPFSLLVNCSGENEEDDAPAQPTPAQRPAERRIAETRERVKEANRDFAKAQKEYEEAQEQFDKEVEEFTGDKKAILDSNKELVTAAEKTLARAELTYNQRGAILNQRATVFNQKQAALRLALIGGDPRATEAAYREAQSAYRDAEDAYKDLVNANSDIESAGSKLEEAQGMLDDVKRQLVKSETRERLEKAEADADRAKRIIDREQAILEELESKSAEDLGRRVLRGVRILFGK